MKNIIVVTILFLGLQANAKDYCQHPTIKAKVNILKQSLPMKIDSATNMYNFVCLDSRYIYYVTLDLKQYTNTELNAVYDFNQNQANSFTKSSNGKIRVRYIMHSLDGTILKIINSKY